MQERGEPPPLILLGCFSHTEHTPRLPPAHVRHCVRDGESVVRVLLGRSPSLPTLRQRRGAAVVRTVRRYYATVRLPSAVHVSRATHVFAERRAVLASSTGVSRFSRMEVPYMLGVPGLRRVRASLALARHTTWPSAEPTASAL